MENAVHTVHTYIAVEYMYVLYIHIVVNTLVILRRLLTYYVK